LDVWARTLSPDHLFDLTRAAVGALTISRQAFAPPSVTGGLRAGGGPGWDGIRARPSPGNRAFG
jgi:hypothetical protein